MNEDREAVFLYAVKMLARRDYSIARLREKLASKFGAFPDDVIDQLISNRFLDDRRYAENYVAGRRKRGAASLRRDLLARGISENITNDVLSSLEWPSLHEAAAARMVDWNLHAPLRPYDAARLFNALVRLGYEEDAVREEIEQLHEQL